MANDCPGLVEAPAECHRIVGRVTGNAPGPTLVAVAALHGNEPAGLEAFRRVLARFQQRKLALRGELVLVCGNLTALSRRCRFVDLDLNRAWTPETLAALGTASSSSDEPVEYREQRELLVVLEEIIASARGPIYFIDMHTCSAEGPPFVTVGDTLRNRRFARAFPLPLILGLEEQVDGALLELVNNFGFVTMGVEAGQHEAPESVDCHEAVLWLALTNAGLLERAMLADHQRYQALLAQASRGAPRVVEVRCRHAIEPGDGFRMESGFANFQPVEAGQVLARKGNGPIRAPESGLVLLPLYQGQGNDGFFISREVHMFWLKVSTVLRRMRLNALIRVLPGVRRHPEQKEALIVDTRVARFYPLEVFHLFGFRKLRQQGFKLVVSRRRYDLQPPSRISFTPSV